MLLVLVPLLFQVHLGSSYTLRRLLLLDSRDYSELFSNVPVREIFAASPPHWLPDLRIVFLSGSCIVLFTLLSKPLFLAPGYGAVVISAPDVL